MAAERFRCDAVVVVINVMGRLIVEGLLADFALSQGIAQGVAESVGVEPLPLKIDHLLLGSADEVVLTSIRAVEIEGIYRRHHIGFQQSPYREIRIIFPM